MRALWRWALFKWKHRKGFMTAWYYGDTRRCRRCGVFCATAGREKWCPGCGFEGSYEKDGCV